MNDSGFEEDQVQLLADLTSQALLHQPAPAAGDPLESLERLVAAAAASSEVPPSSAAYLYGFTLCIGETMRYLTEQERLPADHPIVLGICQHMLAEYTRLVQQICITGKEPAPAAAEDERPVGVRHHPDGIIERTDGQTEREDRLTERLHDQAERADGQSRRADMLEVVGPRQPASAPAAPAPAPGSGPGTSPGPGAGAGLGSAPPRAVSDV